MTIPPIPHLLAWTLGIAGAAALIRFIAKEHRRVNEELELARTASVQDKAKRPTLRRDPRSGVYRP
ncbi:MAG: hypothetical protein ABUL48_04815 [Pseudorhodoplanes sp.]